jgi:flagellar biosynthetic protein FlhB
MDEVLIDLQLFGAEEEGRTELPTERRIRRARERGQVARSIELSQATVILFAAAALLLLAPFFYKSIFSALRYLFENIYRIRVCMDGLKQPFLLLTLTYWKVAFPMMLICSITVLATDLAQVGFLFAPRALVWDFGRIKPDPMRVIRRIIPSKRVLFDFAKAIFKLLIVAFLSYRLLRKEYPTLLCFFEIDTLCALAYVGKLMVHLIIQAAIFLLAMALFDYLFQRKEYIESLKMTPHEVKEEWKQTVGDPVVRARIRERQREMAMARMMQRVPRADVVITNPAHIAVALEYDASVMAAPVLLAKGAGFLAERIEEIAKEHDIPIVQNRPLAQALYALGKIGEEIPPKLYHAVAEVFAFVYKLRSKGWQ